MPARGLTEYEINNNIFVWLDTNGIFTKYKKGNCVNYSVDVKTRLCRKHGAYPLCIKCNEYHTQRKSKICGYCDPSKPKRKKENEIAKLLKQINYGYKRECCLFNKTQ